MAPSPLSLSAFTRIERGDATARVRDALSDSGAAIQDARFFSNVALSLTFELPAEAISVLHAALVATGVRLAEESVAVLAEAALAASTLPREGRSGDVTGTLMLTFLHDEPDLEREVPAVPG